MNIIDNKLITNNDIFQPNNVKRLRKKKFTNKRRPYKTYNDAPWEWNAIFIEIDILKIQKIKNFLNITSIKYGIVYSTLKNKYYDFKNNKIIIDNKEHRGGHNKIFTNEQEENMLIHLKENFINKNEMLCDQMIKIHAVNVFKKLNNNKVFNASSGWCTTYKKRWHLSTVRCSTFKKATTVYSKKELNDFLILCNEKHKLYSVYIFFRLIY